ncbi:MAG: threonylcarbamoyl-AMP synthase [Tannerella sp.]|nr:threonylcarbamoyl-AMP synthase [Tannerella sp.]
MNDDLSRACATLRNGGLILYPTDTIWGIGCDATNADAVSRVYRLKQRTDNKAMLVLIDSAAKLNAYVADIPDIAWDLIEVADKPLTVIYPKARNLAAGLLAEDGSVGIRITGESFSHNLCERFRKPIVSTSANVSGSPSPSSFSEISETIRRGVDYIVNYRRDETVKSRPSGVIKIGEGGLIQVIRE